MVRARVGQGSLTFVLCVYRCGLYRVRVMVFNATFNNISVISWWSVLLAEKCDL
jgi:hypothetical protein